MQSKKNHSLQSRSISSFQDIRGKGPTFPPWSHHPCSCFPFIFFIILAVSTTSKTSNVDVTCNLSYTGTKTAPGKEEDTPFPKATSITAVSFLLLQHYPAHSDTQQGTLVLFTSPIRARRGLIST